MKSNIRKDTERGLHGFSSPEVSQGKPSEPSEPSQPSRLCALAAWRPMGISILGALFPDPCETCPANSESCGRICKSGMATDAWSAAFVGRNAPPANAKSWVGAKGQRLSNAMTQKLSRFGRLESRGLRIRLGV